MHVDIYQFGRACIVNAIVYVRRRYLENFLRGFSIEILVALRTHFLSFFRASGAPKKLKKKAKKCKKPTNFFFSSDERVKVAARHTKKARRHVGCPVAQKMDVPHYTPDRSGKHRKWENSLQVAVDA